MFFSTLLSKLGFCKRTALKTVSKPLIEPPDPISSNVLEVITDEEARHQRRFEELERQFDWSEHFAPLPTAPIGENNSSHKGRSDFADTQPFCADSLQSTESSPRFAPTAPAASLTLPASSTDYAATVPAALLDTAAPIAQPMAISLEDVIDLSRIRNRACPAPSVWQRLHARLSSLPLPDGVSAPPAPLPFDALRQAAFLSKRLAFRSQIEWAAAAGHLDAIYQFMQGMADTEWLYSD